ncbi:hypothetical protein [Pyxidicoccus sp. MSG2]|uniref:hypothetical protein n=1 Tax=Pyxidicoccus sp. MSG2 TaxID=2996790 RepID=UPI00226E3655|nr:hypothetical protein [Pyxidicoccus sp. MSG2]MCY1021689.1 hypothetical protein [Pyxidicoccus sp. MSG2]
MQLRKMMLVLTALGAMSGFMVGCGDEEGTSNTCTTNDDCAGTEICHPTAGVCVTTCESGSDCPDTAKTCAPLGGTGADAATKICQCSTDVLCNGGTGSDSTDMVCSDLDNVCVTKCTADSDCSGDRTCNTGSGQCEEGDTTGDTCTGEGLSTCTYGEICTNSVCAAPPTPTCQNYTSFPNKADLGTTGPIIFKTELVSAQTDSFCAASAPKRLRIRVSAYSNTAFPQTSAELSKFFYVQTDGGRQNAPISSSSGNYTVTGTNRDRADIIVSLCVGATSTTNSAGFYFSGGNFACHTSNYQ